MLDGEGSCVHPSIRTRRSSSAAWTLEQPARSRLQEADKALAPNRGLALA
jgi:hypothetical protein